VLCHLNMLQIKKSASFDESSRIIAVRHVVPIWYQFSEGFCPLLGNARVWVGGSFTGAVLEPRMAHLPNFIEIGWAISSPIDLSTVDNGEQTNKHNVHWDIQTEHKCSLAVPAYCHYYYYYYYLVIIVIIKNALI